MPFSGARLLTYISASLAGLTSTRSVRCPRLYYYLGIVHVLRLHSVAFFLFAALGAVQDKMLGCS